MNDIISLDEGLKTSAFETSCIFFSARWLKVLSESFGFKIMGLRMQDGVLPFADIDDVVGKRIVSLPYSDFVSSGISGACLAEGLNSLRLAYPDHSFSLKLAKDDFPGWPVEDGAMHHEVSLDEEDVMWRRCSTNFRRNVNKARKHAVEVRMRSDEQGIRDFYHQLRDHRRHKFGILTPPLRFFEKLHEHFFRDGAGYVAEACLDGRVCSSVLVLFHGDVACYKFGASDLGALEFRPNNLLFWEVMLDTFKRGCKTLDLGMSWASEDDAGLRRFKEGMGGEPIGLSVIKSWPDEACREREERNRQVFRELTSIFVGQDSDEVLDRACDTLFPLFT
ncbi:GNAT family N-acetyltransferase [uncultured Pseudodesulfovibrio sp.]|uniref:GNAT family N-acetyltransferase n=1 Tax=uncultured Pseudodesulfovibrio sp. TaxID=2035858 RepID=UPI0029C95FE7|nr:GNAT family N-acetyltransferase [uncultured Pseudodesulfovibrio sp.]